MPRKGEIENLLGRRFNRLEVIEFAGHPNRRTTLWKCKCDCGNISIVMSTHLKTGHTKSCGCWLEEVRNNIKNINYKNGLSNSRISNIYYNMINRCYNKNNKVYNIYGGRGISVCSEWKNKDTGFINFCNWILENNYKEDLSPNNRNKFSLDRIDVNGNYCPQNCRIADFNTQANNRRNNIKIKVNGEIDTISNWSRKLNIPYYNIYSYSKGRKNMKYSHLKFEVIQ